MLVGYSVHSLEEAIEAFKNGDDSLVYGHVFPTEFKKGVPARGLEEISDIARSLSIPIIAIGGITPETTKVSLAMEVICFAVSAGIARISTPYSNGHFY